MSLFQTEWETALLGDVCENLDKSRIPITKSKRVSGEIPYYGASGVVDYVEEYIFDEELLLVSEDGANLLARTYPIAFSIRGKTWVNNHAHVLRFESEDSQKFIEYYLNSISLEPYVSGMAQPKLNQKSLNEISVPFPPLPEQKRIVTILDKAFAGISQAVANAEKNIANARELFESYLNNVFAKKGEEWQMQALGDVCELIGGGTPSKKNEKFYKGEIPWATVRDMKQDVITQTEFKINDDAVNNSSTNIIKAGNVVIATRVGLGKVCLISQDTAINQDLRGIVPLGKDRLTVSFLFWWLKSIAHLIEGEGTGATVQGVKLPFVKSLRIPLPSIHKQKQIVDQLDVLRTKTQQLENIYQQKLKALTELKQSILQKAFNGELTADLRMDSSKIMEVETASPEFTARVLAFAYHRHVSQQRDKTFGRVKAQKILHLTESIGGIDLGREPIKDAAGPNDFKHMLRAEDWARDNQFFEFVERDNGYDFKKLSRYNEMMAGALATTNPYRKKLDSIVDLLLPMSSHETKVFSTVHAAWNNLILNGDKITDELIIWEARENWHPDKMKIPVSEFREAIRLIRNKKLVPDGKAKRVRGQENLF